MKNALKFITAILISLSVASAAWALDLKDAKEQGLVGEQPNGYLGVVVESKEAADLVRTVNEKRKAKYEELAKKNGVSLSDVIRLAGKKTIEKTQSGHFIKTPDGQWVKK